MIGRRLGHYRILDLLGSGGMGDVYRAEDTELRRHVALKTIPADRYGSEEELRRIKREARALAALNHPNIVTLYSVEQVDGENFLTMELVEGKSLRELIPSKGLPLDQLLDWAIPIADALAEAHEHGVTHRDLKPGNIMVDSRGTPKVLDFGLAKLLNLPGTDPDTRITTDTLTTAGQAAGTLPYMSPEQVEARQVDQRSDVFSFGTVLYEMATGGRPFAGDSPAALISSILRDTPPSLTEQRDELPRHFERIVSRCLEKKPRRRYQSTLDLRNELKGLERESSTTTVDDESQAPSHRPSWALLALGGFAIIAVAALLSVVTRPPSRPQPRPFQAVPLINSPYDDYGGRLSPDERWLSFISKRGGSARLWVRQIAGEEDRPVDTGDGIVLSHAWSPDGNEIAVLLTGSGSPWLEIVPGVHGGSARMRVPLSTEIPNINLGLVRWHASGIYLGSNQELWVLDPVATEFTKVLPRKERFQARKDFDVTADGSKVVFAAKDEGQYNLWLVSEEERELLSDAASSVEDPLFVGGSAANILFLASRGETTGIWKLVGGSSEEVMLSYPQIPTALDDANSDGSLLVIGVTHEASGLWLTSEERGGSTPLTSGSVKDYGPTARGSSVAFQRALPQAEVGMSLVDAEIHIGTRGGDGMEEDRLIARPGYSPRLSPSGQWLAHLRPSDTPPFLTSVWLVDVHSNRASMVHDGFLNLGFRILPTEWVATNLTWHPVRDEFFFAGLVEGDRPAIGRVEAGEGPLEIEWILVSDGSFRERMVRDISLRTDDPELAFIEIDRTADLAQVRTLDTRTGEGRTVLSRPLAPFRHSRLLGWLPDGQLVLLVAETRHEDGSGDGKIIIMGTTVTEQHAAARDVELSGIAFERVFPRTATLDTLHGAVVATAVDDGLHNVVRISLASGAVAQITDNLLPAVSFSGLGTLPDGSLIYARHERNKDIWLRVEQSP